MQYYSINTVKQTESTLFNLKRQEVLILVILWLMALRGHLSIINEVFVLILMVNGAVY